MKSSTRLPDPLPVSTRLGKQTKATGSFTEKKPCVSRSGQVNDDARYLERLSALGLVDMVPIFMVDDVQKIFNGCGRGPLRSDVDHSRVAGALDLMVRQAVTRKMMSDSARSPGRQAAAFENIGERARDLLAALGYNCDGPYSPEPREQSAGAGAALGHLRHLLRNYASPPLRNTPLEAMHLIRRDNRFVDHITPPSDQHDPDAHWERVIAAETLSMLPEALAALIELSHYAASHRRTRKARTKPDDVFSAVIFGRWILAYKLGTGSLPTGGKGKRTTSIEVGPLVCALKIAADRLPACLRGMDGGTAVAALQRLAGLPYATLAGHIKSSSDRHRVQCGITEFRAARAAKE